MYRAEPADRRFPRNPSPVASNGVFPFVVVLGCRGSLARPPDGGIRRTSRRDTNDHPVSATTRPVPGRFPASMNPLASHPGRTAGRNAGRKRSAPKERLGAVVRLALAGHSPGERPAGTVLPALAVLGRSNVGKSSLLNALLGVPAARVSATPGRTQALYWYRVDETFDLVDCPGYGFAKTSRHQRRKHEALIEELLAVSDGGTPSGFPPAASGRVIAGALLLVDGRLAPQEADRSMALFLENSGIPIVVVATKWDAVKPSARTRQLRALAAEFARDDRPLLPVSSETGENLSALVRLVRDRLGALPCGRIPSDATALPS